MIKYEGTSYKVNGIKFFSVITVILVFKHKTRT